MSQLVSEAEEKEKRQARGQLLMLKGAISDLTPEEQQSIKNMRAKLDALIAEDMNATLLAIAQVGLEIQLGLDKSVAA